MCESSIPALVIVGNGPGEIAGWAVPVAAEARRWAEQTGRPIEINLCLPPCQFASGQEQAAATTTRIFDHVINPRGTLRLALGLPGWAPSAAPVLLHVGGDFWYSRRLARRWGARAFAFVERAHVRRVHRAFEQIFVPTRDLADRLASYGVPATKVVVTGDPRFDALPRRQTAVPGSNGPSSRQTITFLPGSRDHTFSAYFPFWIETAVALRSRLPDARLRILISPYVSSKAHEGMVGRHGRTIEATGITVEYGGWSRVVGSDLVLTLPGTNTMELAILGIPGIVVLPMQLPSGPPAGLFEWVVRVPYTGVALKRLLAPAYRRRFPLVALPNIRLRRQIMPELVGDVTPEQVAEEGARLLHDEGARRKIIQDLMEIPDETGAARRILTAINPFQTAA